MADAVELIVEDGKRSDAGALVDLDQRNFLAADWFSRRLWISLLGDQATNRQTLTLVARQGPRLVGAIVGRFRPAQAEVAIWSIAVDEDFRGSGLAERLTADLVVRIPASFRSITLDARRDNARARRFYERLGFQVVREVRGGYTDGTDAIQYRASLDALRQALGSLQVTATS